MIGARLGVPVVPVRLDGLDQVLPPPWQLARRVARARCAFGAPIVVDRRRLRRLAARVEAAVRAAVWLRLPEAVTECGTIFDCRKGQHLSKDDLIDVQGTVVAVHSGGLYRVQCDRATRCWRS